MGMNEGKLIGDPSLSINLNDLDSSYSGLTTSTSRYVWCHLEDMQLSTN